MTMRAMRRKIFTGGAWGGATVLGGPRVCARVVDTVGKVFDEINGNSADWVC